MHPYFLSDLLELSLVFSYYRKQYHLRAALFVKNNICTSKAVASTLALFAFAFLNHRLSHSNYFQSPSEKSCGTEFEAMGGSRRGGVGARLFVRKWKDLDCLGPTPQPIFGPTDGTGVK